MIAITLGQNYPEDVVESYHHSPLFTIVKCQDCNETMTSVIDKRNRTGFVFIDGCDYYECLLCGFITDWVADSTIRTLSSIVPKKKSPALYSLPIPKRPDLNQP